MEIVFLSVILANLDSKKASVRWDYHLSGVAERGGLYARLYGTGYKDILTYEDTFLGPAGINFAVLHTSL